MTHKKSLCYDATRPPLRRLGESVLMPPEYQPAQTATVDELIERCLTGDQQAWEQIVRLHRRKVFNVAYKFVGKHDEAEDLTQDIFLKIFRSLDTFALCTTTLSCFFNFGSLGENSGEP